MNRHFYRPREGHGLRHNPFKAIVAPRPIGWIGTHGPSGVRNLAPYSFFNAFSDDPPIVGFASMGRKDSLDNAESSGEFSWNLVGYDQAGAMNASSAALAPEEDEFVLAGLESMTGVETGAPLVRESGVCFECRTTQVIQLQDIDGVPLDRWLLLGQVVGVHIDNSLIADGVYLTGKARPVMRGGGLADYFVVDDRDGFQMHRPR